MLSHFEANHEWLIQFLGAETCVSTFRLLYIVKYFHNFSNFIPKVGKKQAQAMPRLTAHPPSLKSLSLLWNHKRYVGGGSALRAHINLGDMWVTGTKCDYPLPLPMTHTGYPLPWSLARAIADM